jgi:ABC-type uncharacterized transport system auxiliary subunit
VIHRWQRVLVIDLFSFLTGCFGFGGGSKEADDIQPRFYIVDVDRGNVAAQFAQNRVLRIKPIRIAPHYRTENIVFRVGESEYQPQAGHVLLTDPQVMFTSQLQRWLAKSGLFSDVITDDSQPADLVLEAAVTKLYGDNRSGYSPQAVLEMQFFMSPGDADRSKMLFQTGFRVDASIDQTTSQNVVTGWQNALELILATLEQDLSVYFNKAGTP